MSVATIVWKFLNPPATAREVWVTRPRTPLALVHRPQIIGMKLEGGRWVVPTTPGPGSPP